MRQSCRVRALENPNRESNIYLNQKISLIIYNSSPSNKLQYILIKIPNFFLKKIVFGSTSSRQQCWNPPFRLLCRIDERKYVSCQFFINYQIAILQAIREQNPEGHDRNQVSIVFESPSIWLDEAFWKIHDSWGTGKRNRPTSRIANVTVPWGEWGSSIPELFHGKSLDHWPTPIVILLASSILPHTLCRIHKRAPLLEGCFGIQGVCLVVCDDVHNTCCGMNFNRLNRGLQKNK